VNTKVENVWIILTLIELLKKYVDDRGKYLITREHGQVVSI
jgi:hypothetical protein